MSCRSILPAKATKAALRRLLKNSEKQIPHRLKAASMTKVKGLNGTTEVVPFPEQRSNGVFSQPIDPVLLGVKRTSTGAAFWP